MGQHLYVNQFGTTSRANIARVLAAVRNAYLTYEGRNTPKRTVVTEFGWSTALVSPRVQASNLRTALATFRNTGYVAQVYWFAVQDIPEGNIPYGLVDGDGAEKPAFAVYQATSAPSLTSSAANQLYVRLPSGVWAPRPQINTQLLQQARRRLAQGMGRSL